MNIHEALELVKPKATSEQWKIALVGDWIKSRALREKLTYSEVREKYGGWLKKTIEGDAPLVALYEKDQDAALKKLDSLLPNPDKLH